MFAILKGGQRLSHQLTATGLLVVLAGFNLWLLLVYRLPGKTVFWRALHDAGHGLIFLLLSLLLCLIFHTFLLRHTLRVAIAALLISLAFGGLVELIQPQFGRSGTWSDFWLDLLGTCAGISLYLSSVVSGFFRWCFLMLAIGLIWFDLATPMAIHWAEQERNARFPLIADFENRWLSQFLKPANTASLTVEAAPAAWRQNSGRVAKLVQRPGDWPGIYIVEVVPDWRGYTSLDFDVFNPLKEPVRLSVRVHDRLHNHLYPDRYNRTFRLAPGAQRISIPLDDIRMAPKGRQMSMAEIQSIIFYTYKLNAERTLYFDDIRLRGAVD